MEPTTEAAWSRVRRAVLGAPDRLGFWVLPVFLIVALAGAVLAGSLTVVFYSQRVDELTATTAEDRDTLARTADEILAARDDALARVDEQVSAVEQSLQTGLPVADAIAFGVVVVRTRTTAGAAALDGVVLAQAEGQPSDEATQPGEPGPATPVPSPAPTAAEPPGPTPAPPRIGNAFAVARDDRATFFATSHGLVADPASPEGVLAAVEIVLPSGSAVATVHTWDDTRDLALLRAEGIGNVAIPRWRPFETPLAVGDRLVAVGLTPSFATIRTSATLAFGDVTMLVSDLRVPDFLRGGPVVDSDGLVVGVVTTAYQPFGSAGGDAQAMPPAQLLCEQLLRNCGELQGAAG